MDLADDDAVAGWVVAVEARDRARGGGVGVGDRDFGIEAGEPAAVVVGVGVSAQERTALVQVLGGPVADGVVAVGDGLVGSEIVDAREAVGVVVGVVYVLAAGVGGLGQAAEGVIGVGFGEGAGGAGEDLVGAGYCQIGSGLVHLSLVTPTLAGSATRLATSSKSTPTSTFADTSPTGVFTFGNGVPTRIFPFSVARGPISIRVAASAEWSAFEAGPDFWARLKMWPSLKNV